MFERFTERARQVVVLAQEEARALKHNYIGTEHILLGLLREALSLGHNYIGTEHILLGLARENEGVAARILLDFDVDSERIRNEVIRALSGHRSVHRSDVPNLAVTVPTGGDAPDRAMAAVEHGIRNILGREPDNGDLLVILACLPHGVVARALTDLGIDDAKLADALTRARAAGPDQIEDQIRLIRRQKDDALDHGDVEQATALRARERELTAAENVDLIGEVRARLGLSPGAE